MGNCQCILTTCISICSGIIKHSWPALFLFHNHKLIIIARSQSDVAEEHTDCYPSIESNGIIKFVYNRNFIKLSSYKTLTVLM